MGSCELGAVLLVLRILNGILRGDAWNTDRLLNFGGCGYGER
jgi:hypothetical protein